MTDTSKGYFANEMPRRTCRTDQRSMISIGMVTRNSFNTFLEIRAGGQTVQIYRLPALEKAGFSGVPRLPYSMKILLENLLRREDNAFVKSDDIEALARWD